MDARTDARTDEMHRVYTIAITTGIRRGAIYRVFTLFPTLFNPQNNLSSPKDILPRATLLPYLFYEEGE